MLVGMRKPVRYDKDVTNTIGEATTMEAGITAQTVPSLSRSRADSFFGSNFFDSQANPKGTPA